MSSLLVFVVSKMPKATPFKAGYAHSSFNLGLHEISYFNYELSLKGFALEQVLWQLADETLPLMISRYDKKRAVPKHSSVHQLRYAQKKA